MFANCSSIILCVTLSNTIGYSIAYRLYNIKSWTDLDTLYTYVTNLSTDSLSIKLRMASISLVASVWAKLANFQPVSRTLLIDRIVFNNLKKISAEFCWPTKWFSNQMLITIIKSMVHYIELYRLISKIESFWIIYIILKLQLYCLLNSV